MGGMAALELRLLRPDKSGLAMTNGGRNDSGEWDGGC
jgi:hypothetical protein